MAGLYQMRQPRKEKFGWRDIGDIIDLLGKGLSIYAGFKQLGLAGEQEKRLAEQRAWERTRTEGLDAQAAAESAAKAHEGYDKDVLGLFEKGYSQREPRYQDLDPDIAAAMNLEGALPRGSVSRPEIPEYQPGMSALDLITGGAMVEPDVQTEAEKAAARLKEHQQFRDYDVAHPFPPTPESPGDIEARQFKQATTPGIVTETAEQQEARAPWNEFMADIGGSYPPGANVVRPGMYYDPSVAASAAGLRAGAVAAAKPQTGTPTQSQYVATLIRAKVDYIKQGYDEPTADSMAHATVDSIFQQAGVGPAAGSGQVAGFVGEQTGTEGASDRDAAVAIFRQGDPLTPLSPAAEAKLEAWYVSFERDPEQFRAYLAQHKR